MNWNKVDRKLTRRLERDEIDTEDKYEKATILATIKQELPQYTMDSIRSAINKTFNEKESPIPQNIFLESIEEILTSPDYPKEIS